MMGTAASNEYGVMTAPDTLRIERLLPGPVELVWTYLTESELRSKWFAGGEMSLEIDAPLELVWRNDELTDPPGRRPDGISGENRMQSRITELDPPRKLVITWGEAGAVSFELETRGADVMLTVVHSRVTDRARVLSYAPGWHAHLDILAALLSGATPKPFWDEFRRLTEDYELLMPA